jgi:glutathione synthase/RimK-type ligase-like ATP-grasp enzyme
MKIAIHNTKSEGFFDNYWINYCKKNNIEFKLVNAYDSNIVDQVKDCTAFMWHHSNYDYRDALFAKQLLYSLEQKGMKVFPDFNTTWHFDDKVGQKYLLEAIGAPLVTSYVFYTKKEALEWINNTTFPKVFKLRGGSGSSNVKLARTKSQAKKLTNIAFGRGFSQFDRWNHLKFRYANFKSGKESFIAVLKGIARLFITTNYSNNFQREKGYIYFQEFISNNSFDIRVVVVGDKAFALKRLVRKGDFRASGGGNIIYDKNQIDERCVRIAFEVNEKIKSQSIAYDFVFDKDYNPLIVEISYGYTAPAYDKCEGYWDRDLNWYEGENFDFCGWMIENLI